MRFAKYLMMISGAVALVSCATIIDGQTQMVTINTPGASESKCYANNGLRYPFYGGQTVEIQRSRNDLVIECYGSGNRYKKKIVESTLNDWTVANVSNGVVPGTAYDVNSGAFWGYPAVIDVDFVGVPTKGFEMPEYHNKDLPSPYDQAVENMGPSTPRVESDRDYVPRKLEKRDASSMGSNPFSSFESNNNAAAPEVTPMPGASASPAPAAPVPAPKGMTADELTRSMNPHVFNQ